MKKSVSIPDELAYKVMDTVYVNTARDPKNPSSFSQVVVDALKLFFQSKKTEVNVCKSVSIRDELAYKVMDAVYIKNARDPKNPSTFSSVVNQALELFFQSKKTEVNICKS